jgi:hypothetical protein
LKEHLEHGERGLRCLECLAFRIDVLYPEWFLVQSVASCQCGAAKNLRKSRSLERGASNTVVRSDATYIVEDT